MALVYKITNTLNDKSYIGVTQSSLSQRMSSHKFEANKGNPAEVYEAMRMFGIINFEVEVLEECTGEEMFQKEQYYIQKYNTLSPNGYNSTTGGSLGSKHSNSVCEKKSISQKRRWKTVNKKEFSKKMKAMFKDDDVKSAHRLGLVKSWTEERRQQFRELYEKNTNFINAKGYVKSAEACSKSVILFDTTTRQETEYKSVSDCARSNGWSVAAVSKQIKRKGFLFGKYLVKFKIDDTSFDNLVTGAKQKNEDVHTKMSEAKKGMIPWNKKSGG